MMYLPSTVIKSMATSTVLFWTKRSVLSVKIFDASVVTPDDYAATVWIPPIHFNCRCIWVAIMEDETDKPEFTGLPDTPGGATAPLLAASRPAHCLW